MGVDSSEPHDLSNRMRIGYRTIREWLEAYGTQAGRETIGVDERGFDLSEVTSAVHVRITGRVQGVGYRHWAHLRATHAGLTGFVRNRADGSVEAVFAGPAAEVEDMVLRCRVGPRGSSVADVVAAEWDGANFDDFSVLPTE